MSTKFDHIFGFPKLLINNFLYIHRSLTHFSSFMQFTDFVNLIQ